jgi:hypothetical protein
MRLRLVRRWILFGKNHNKLQRWRAGALQRYRDTFMAETMAQKYVGVYKNLLNH